MARRVLPRSSRPARRVVLLAALALLPGCAGGALIPPPVPAGASRADPPAQRWPDRTNPSRPTPGGQRPAPAAPSPLPGRALDPAPGGAIGPQAAAAPPFADPAADPGPLRGLSAGAVLARFGRPVLDVREGAGRKLQYRGPCVLDVFLYPPTPGAAPVVVHAEARLPDGRAADRAACLARLSPSR